MRILTDVDPARLKKWLIALGVIYLIFPRDLIPDYLGRGLGFIDDASLIAFLTYFYRKHLREFAGRMGRSGAQREAPARPAAAGAELPDPYTVLGVPRSASPADITAAYKARMKEYHPDKVSHLGSELQDLAHRKVIEIQDAYARLRK